MVANHARMAATDVASPSKNIGKRAWWSSLNPPRMFPWISSTAKDRVEWDRSWIRVLPHF
jgi:hypothetical protein